MRARLSDLSRGPSKCVRIKTTIADVYALCDSGVVGFRQGEVSQKGREVRFGKQARVQAASGSRGGWFKAFQALTLQTVVGRLFSGQCGTYRPPSALLPGMNSELPPRPDHHD